MNVQTRIAFVLIGLACLTTFGYNFATSWHTLSAGHGLVLGSLGPAGLMMFAVACKTQTNKNEIIALAVMFLGIALAMVMYGMYKVTGYTAYGIFAWEGLMLVGVSIALVVFYPTPLTRSAC